MIDTKEKLEAYYRSILPALQMEAWYCGWGLGVHGSLRRDLDLIAVPWRSDARTEHWLAHRLMKKAGVVAWDARYIKTQWEKKPHGRMAIALPIVRQPEKIQIMGEGIPKEQEIHMGYLDLSIMPRV